MTEGLWEGDDGREAGYKGAAGRWATTRGCSISPLHAEEGFSWSTRLRIEKESYVCEEYWQANTRQLGVALSTPLNAAKMP